MVSKGQFVGRISLIRYFSFRVLAPFRSIEREDRTGDYTGFTLFQLPGFHQNDTTSVQYRTTIRLRVRVEIKERLKKKQQQGKLDTPYETLVSFV